MKGKFCNSERQCVDLTILIENFTLFFVSQPFLYFFCKSFNSFETFQKKFENFSIDRKLQKERKRDGRDMKTKSINSNKKFIQ